MQVCKHGAACNMDREAAAAKPLQWKGAWMPHIWPTLGKSPPLHPSACISLSIGSAPLYVANFCTVRGHSMG